MPWSKLDWPAPPSKGLFARRQQAPNDRLYGEVVRNVDFQGGVIGKRQGSQYETGWGAYATSAWTSQTTGPVDSTTGFVVGQSVNVIDPVNGSVTRTVAAGTTGTTLVVTSPIGFLPTLHTGFLSQRQLASGGRVDGLFQAVFRDATSALLAWAGAQLFFVKSPPTTSVAATLAFPETTVRAGEGWAATTTGKLDVVETLRVGDTLTRLTGLEGRTVTAVDQTFRTVTVSPGYSSNPGVGETFRFFPPPAAGDAHFVQFANLTHMASANYPPVKLTGSNSGTAREQRQGIIGPQALTNAAVDGAGVLNGAYTYRTKYVNSVTGAESEPSPTSNPVSPVNQQVVVTFPIGSPDPQVDKMRLYRTLSGGAGAWFFVVEVADGTVSYTDNTPDSGLGDQMREFLDNVPPTDLTVIGLWPHANRLIGITRTGSALVFSDEPDLETGFLKGESWPVNNQIFLNYDDGDPIVGAIGFFDSLLVFKTRSIWRVTGEPPNLTIEPVSFRSDLTAIGALNQKTIAVDQNEVIFAAQDGVYQIDRFWGVQQGFQSQRLSRQIDALYETLNTLPGVPQKAHAVFFRAAHQYRLFLPLGADTEPNDLLVHQFDGTPEGEAIGWARWALFLAMTASCVAKGNPDVVFIGTNNGHVLRLDQGNLDQGYLSYDVEYRTVPFTPAGPGIPARGRAVDVVVQPETAVVVTVELASDFILAASSALLSLPQSPNLGLDLVTGRALVLSRAQWHQLTFRESGFNTALRINGFSYFIQPLPPESQVVSAQQAAISYP